MKKIMFWSDSVVPTGFSNVAHSIIKYLPREEFESIALGINYFGDPHSYSHKIYPASLRGDLYGINRVEEVLRIESPDLIFIINDAWVQDSMLQKIKEVTKDKKLPKIVSYVPVDAEDHDPDWYKNFDIVDRVVAYTEFGKSVILKAAPHLADKLSVIEHGVDTSIYHKLDIPKSEVKKLIFPDRADFLDSFIVFNGNRNQERKRIDISIQAFSLFAQNKPENVKLYLHMGVVDAHINIQKLCKRYGIERRLIVSNNKTGVQSVSPENLNLIYNATEVGLNTGVGEGFGLVNVEHTVCGSPQVVGNHSSLTDLYKDCGLLVEPNMAYVLNGIMTTGYLIRPEDVAEKLESLYADKNLYSFLSEKGISKFSKEEYSWKHISSLFADLFNSIL